MVSIMGILSGAAPLMLDVRQTGGSPVVLNDTGTRMLRSWRHVENVCPQCGATGTEELSLNDIATVVDD
jgi:hypothetical protein